MDIMNANTAVECLHPLTSSLSLLPLHGGPAALRLSRRGSPARRTETPVASWLRLELRERLAALQAADHFTNLPSRAPSDTTC